MGWAIQPVLLSRAGIVSVLRRVICFPEESKVYLAQLRPASVMRNRAYVAEFPGSPRFLNCRGFQQRVSFEEKIIGPLQGISSAVEMKMHVCGHLPTRIRARVNRYELKVTIFTPVFATSFGGCGVRGGPSAITGRARIPTRPRRERVRIIERVVIVHLTPSKTRSIANC